MLSCNKYLCRISRCTSTMSVIFTHQFTHQFCVKFTSTRRQIDVSLTYTLRKFYAKLASLLRKGETCLRGRKSQNVSWDSQNTPFRQIPASSDNRPPDPNKSALLPPSFCESFIRVAAKRQTPFFVHGRIQPTNTLYSQNECQSAAVFSLCRADVCLRSINAIFVYNDDPLLGSLGGSY